MWKILHFNRERGILYLIAVLATAAVVLLRYALAGLLGHDAPLLLFILAVLLSAWLGGLKPGLLATVLSAVAGTCLFIEREGLHILKPSDQVRVVLFVLIGGITSWLCEAVHRSRRRLLARQQVLQESYEQLRQFIANAPAPLAMFDRNMRYLSASRRWLTGFGLADRDLIGQSHYEVFPDIPARWRATHQRGLAGEPLHAEEDRFERRDGSCMWLRWELLPWRTNSGEVGGILIFFEDITKRKLAEEELRQRERRHYALITALSEMVWRTGPHGEAAEPSREWTELTGQATENSSGEGWLEALHPDDRAATREWWQEALRTQQPYEAEYRVRRPDGPWRNMLARGQPVRDEDGQVKEWVGVLLDVTERKQAEQTVRSSEMRLNFALETSHTGAWELDLVDHTAHRTLIHDRIFGYRELLPQWTYEMFLEHVLPEDRATVDEKFRRTAETRSDWSFECRIRRTDGELRWIWAAGRTSRNESGQPYRMAGIVQDVTERKRAEEALAESERRLRAILDNEPECVTLLTADGTVLEMNPAGLAMIEAESAAQVIGQNICPLVRPQYREAFLDLTRRVFAGEAGMLEFEVAGLKGGVRWLETHAVPFRGREGRISALLGVTRDITERKKLQERVLASQHMLETVLNNIPQGVFWKDRASRYLGCNAVVCRSFGLDLPEQIIGKTDFDLPGLEQDQAAFFIQKDREVMESGEPIYGIIEQATLADGSTIWMQTNKMPLRDGQGQVTGILGTWEDITERKRLEEQLRQSQKMDAVGQLAGGVAHDFNNMLTVINGFTNMLLDELPADHAMRHDLEQVRDAGERAAGLTRQLLAFSRQAMMEVRVFDLNAVVGESEKMLRRVIGEDIELTVRPARALSRVKADPGQIGQVLLNLALNARDAMPRGGKLTIETSNAEFEDALSNPWPDPKPGRYVLLAVSDNGCGMTREIMARIFEPFYTTKGPGKGTGLGLAVVHGIVKQSGGHIEAYSELGQGSAFKVYLPAAEEEAVSLKGKNNGETAKRGTETVLLVEDEEAVRRIAAVALRSSGYTVLTAASGTDALRIAEEQRGDIALLVTDMVMPGVSGRELADALRRRYSRLKVLFISGYTSDAVLRHGVLGGEEDFLQKPFTPVSLANKVREVLDKQ